MGSKDVHEAKKRLSDWFMAVNAADIGEFTECARTYADWMEEILNIFRTGLSNGYTEGVQQPHQGDKKEMPMGCATLSGSGKGYCIVCRLKVTKQGSMCCPCRIVFMGSSPTFDIEHLKTLESLKFSVFKGFTTKSIHISSLQQPSVMLFLSCSYLLLCESQIFDFTIPFWFLCVSYGRWCSFSLIYSILHILCILRTITYTRYNLYSQSAN